MLSANPRPSKFSEHCTRWAEHLVEFGREQWRAVLFSAGLATILEAHGVLRVLTKFSLLVVSSLAAQAPSAPQMLMPGMPVVVVLNNQDFITRYGERSPLNRCTMAGDIQQVLGKSPARLAVDFDLSPLAAASADEERCQDRLDDLLDRHAAKLLLLVPFAAATEQLLNIKHDWLLARCSHGLNFVDGTLDQSLGMVTEQRVADDAAGASRMADQLQQGGSDHICATAKSGTARQNKWLNGLDEAAGGDGAETPQAALKTHEAHEPEMVPINFRALTRKVAVLALNSPAWANTVTLQDHAVLMGGDWGRDDSFLTAIGSLPGVVIHAARLASLADPVKPLPPLVSLWGDVVIALFFAFVISKFWRGYVIASRLDLHFARSGRVTAMSVMVMSTFVVVYLSLVLFFFLAAEHMFSNLGVVIAPLLIAVSILVDGFISGPVEQISQLLKAETKLQRPGPETVEPALAEQLSPVFRQTSLAWALVLVFATLCVLAPSFSHGLAAWLFIGAQVALAVLVVGLLVYRVGRSLRGKADPEVDAGERVALHRPPATPAVSPQWQNITRIGVALRWLRWLMFWSVLAYAGVLLIQHSLPG